MKSLDTSVFNIYTFLLALIAFTIPMPMLTNNIAFGLLILFWLYLLFTKKLKWPNPKHFLILTIPYVILLIGAFSTTNISQLGTELTKNLPFVILPLILLSVPRSLHRVNYKIIAKAFILANILISLLLLGIILKTIILQGFSLEIFWNITHQSLSSYVDINAIYLSLYLAVSLIIVTYNYVQTEYSKPFSSRLKHFLVMALFAVLLVFLSSRTVMFSCAFLIVLLWIHHFFQQKNVLKSMLRVFIVGSLIGLAGLAINPVLKWRIESVLLSNSFDRNQTKEEGIQMRERLWKSAYEVFENNYIFGVGTGDFKEALDEVYKSHKYRVQYRFKMNSHNQYLSVMVSNGLIGILLFMLYLLYPLVLYIKYKNWGLVALTCLFMLCFITESYLYTNKGVIVVAFVISLMYVYFLNLNFQFSHEKE